MTMSAFRVMITSPVPASSGMTNRHRLSRAGHREANAALYRAVIVRMRFHQPTIDYVARRTAEGLSKRDIIRCLKRYLAREVYQAVMTDHRSRQRATGKTGLLHDQVTGWVTQPEWLARS